MRYIIIPPAVRAIDPASDTPCVDEQGNPAMFTFAVAARGLCSEILRTKSLDVLDVIELRMRLTFAKEGDEVAIEDEWWPALVEAFKRPSAMLPAYLIASTPHILAVKNATTSSRGPLV
jgi:hypothetical protein